MPELGGSALDLLQHYALVETAFLGLVSGEEIRRPKEDWTYEEIRDLLGRTAAGFRQRMPSFVTRLEDTVHVPWFGRTFTVEQVLQQVVTHSVQHRAGVCAGMARAGKEAPDLDYIVWLSQFR
jgi:uncharacterized damage-inducible protein DinB